MSEAVRGRTPHSHTTLCAPYMHSCKSAVPWSCAGAFQTPALCAAAEEGKIHTVQLLLARGADPAAMNSRGSTALHSGLPPPPCSRPNSLPACVESACGYGDPATEQSTVMPSAAAAGRLGVVKLLAVVTDPSARPPAAALSSIAPP